DFEHAYNGIEGLSRAYKLGRSFHLFGFDAPPITVVSAQKDPNDATTAYLINAKTSFALDTSTDAISLDARHPSLTSGSVVLLVATRDNVTCAIPFEISHVSEQFAQRFATTQPPAPLT